jgi:putative redox protein
MELIVNYIGGVQFEIQARGHRVVCDQPVEGGGADAGLTPPEFLLASLGSCAAYYAAQYLRTRSLPVEGLEVKVSAEKSLGPARLASFRIQVRVPGLEDEKHRAGVLRAAKSCLIHNTLLQPAAIELVLDTELAACV